MEFFWRGTENAGITASSALRLAVLLPHVGQRLQTGMGRAAGMQDESRQDGGGCELCFSVGMQGAENIASRLTNKKSRLVLQRLIANICGLWSSQNGEKNLLMLEQALGGGYGGCIEKLGCSQLQAQGVIDLQGTPSEKKKGGGGVSKRRYKKQLAATKNNCMALQKITMAIKKLFGGGRRREDVSKMPRGWTAG